LIEPRPQLEGRGFLKPKEFVGVLSLIYNLIFFFDDDDEKVKRLDSDAK
jgi:hypothetical protein